MNQRMHYFAWEDEEYLKSQKRDHFVQTVEEYNGLVGKIKKDDGWFDKYIDLCKHYYEQECCGGNMHIVLDDGNINDSSVSWCAGLAHGRQDHEASDLANLMLMMTEKQRTRVYNSYPY